MFPPLRTMPYYRTKYRRNLRTGKRRVVKKSYKTKMYMPNTRRYTKMRSSAGNGRLAGAPEGERIYYN